MDNERGGRREEEERGGRQDEEEEEEEEEQEEEEEEDELRERSKSRQMFTKFVKTIKAQSSPMKTNI